MLFLCFYSKIYVLTTMLFLEWCLKEKDSDNEELATERPGDV